MKRTLSILVIVLSLSLIITGCGLTGITDDSSLTGEMGEFILQIADRPVNGIKEVNVTFERVEVHNADTDTWKVVNDFSAEGGTQTFNLLNLRFNADLLGQEKLSTGTYDQIRMIVATPDETTGKNGAKTYSGLSHVVYEDGDKEGIFIPSGTATGIKVPQEFTISKDAITRLVADINVKEVLHSAGKSDKIILNPSTAIDVIPTVISGNITGRVLVDADKDGTVEDNEVITEDIGYDVVVEAYNKGDDPAEVKPVKSTVALVKKDGTKPAGSYLLRGLEEGEYIIKAKIVNGDGELVKDSEGNPVYEQPTQTVNVTAQETNSDNLFKVNCN